MKANTAEEQRSKPGGTRPGHTGHGRQAVEDSDRSVIDSQPLHAESIL